MGSFMVYTHHPILFGSSKQNKWEGWSMWHAWGTGEVHAGFWWGIPRERDHLKDLEEDGRLISRWIFREWDGELRLD
jgi:hypothetical protein